MEVNYSNYTFTDSLERIDEILDSSDNGYEEHKGIPSRDRLTFTNGFYVDVTVLFVDMRGSKALAELHTRPVLAKIYRTYISEIVAVMRGNLTISEIYIEGDGLFAVFNTTTKPEVDGVLETTGQICSLIDILNVKLKKKGYSTISAGIGLDDGTSLYAKAGYKNSGINEVIWIGKVVGQAAALCKDASRSIFSSRVKASKRIYECLKPDYQKFFTCNLVENCYDADVVNVVMNTWVGNNA